ncbi:MAG: hypothetical protein R2831_11465 [Chitinophagaceae bacterium]
MIGKREKQIRYIILFTLIISTFCFVMYKNVLLNISGKYTVAIYKGSTSGGRQGGSDYYKFFYNGRYYEQGIKIIRSKIKLYYYCKFVPNNPSICNILYDKKVPYCVTPSSVPDSGWLKIPEIECPEDKPPLYTGRIEIK